MTSSREYFTLNDKDYIHRHEFYGGLIHSRTDGTRFELDHPTFSLLRALSFGLNADAACSLVADTFDSAPHTLRNALTEAINARLVFGSPPPISSIGIADARAKLRAEHDEATSRTYLRAPLNLSIYTIMACHLDCKFCYLTDEKWQPGAARPSQWIQLIGQAKEAGVPFISFLGGDPALYRGMPDLVEAVDALNIKATMTTNGVRISDRLFETVAASKALTPVVSIQSTDELHEQLTGRSYREPVATIKRFNDRGKACHMNMVYTQQSMDQVRSLLDLAASLNVSKFTVGVFTNIAKADLPVPTFREYRKLHEAMLAYAKERDFKMLIQTEGCQLYTAYPDTPYRPSTVFEHLTLGCEAGQSRGEIMHDGTLLGCALQDKNRWAGQNVFDVGLQGAWDNSNALDRVRRLQNKDSACTSGECHFSSFCNGGCPAHNEAAYGAPDAGGDPRCGIRDDIIQRNQPPSRVPHP